MLLGIYVLYAMAAVLPFSILWYGFLTAWKRVRGDGQAPRSFSLWTGLLSIGMALLLQFQMTPQTRIPGPDWDLYPFFWLVSLSLFTYGLPATWIALAMFSRTAGTRPPRVKLCDRCGNREDLHTEYCVRCGNRFIPRRPLTEASAVRG